MAAAGRHGRHRPPRYEFGVDGVGAARPGACGEPSNESRATGDRASSSGSFGGQRRGRWVGGGRAGRRVSVEAAGRGGGGG